VSEEFSKPESHFFIGSNIEVRAIYICPRDASNFFSEGLGSSVFSEVWPGGA
jgi:hypothetical protein